MALMFLCKECLSKSKLAAPTDPRTKNTRCTICHENADCSRLDSAAQRIQAPRPPGPEVPRENHDELLEFPKEKESKLVDRPLRERPPEKPKKVEKTIGPALLTAAHFAAKARDAQKASFSSITDEILKSALEVASRGACSYVLSGDEFAVCSDEVKDELLRRKFSFTEASQAGQTTITIMW